MKSCVSLAICTLLIAISQAQNVGIGTTSPTSALHVYSNSSVDTKIETNNAFGSSTLLLKSPGGINDYLKMIKNGASASGSQAGINLANLSQITTGADAGGLMIGNVTSNPLYFLTGNTERMRILGNGNIGINTTNPQYPLQVEGTSQHIILALNNNASFGNGVIGMTFATDGAGIGGVAGSIGETISVSDPGQYGLMATTGAATGIGSFTLTGTAVRAKSASGLALHTTGGIRFTGISEGANKVLTSDASGNATWQTFNQNPNIGFLVVLGANQSVSNSTNTFFSSMTEAFDDGNNLDNTTGSTAFVAPSAGLYHLETTIYWPSPVANTLVRVQFLINGVAPSGGEADYVLQANTSTTSNSLNMKLSAGNTVQVRIIQVSGTTLTMGGGLGTSTTTFSGYKVY